jgi:isopentenyl-diphosphate delta-isomerase type 1
MNSLNLSADSDSLILVDDSDQDVGHLSKARCHEGKGILHRAFSLLIFNDAGELLIQQRSPRKRLWPLYWSNSCCSHPRSGESTEAATRRRLFEELGMVCPLKFLFKFQYQAQFDATGSEHELCSVFILTKFWPGAGSVRRRSMNSWLHRGLSSSHHGLPWNGLGFGAITGKKCSPCDVEAAPHS